MHIQHDSQAPDLNALSGTNNEPACHFHARDVQIRCTPSIDLLTSVNASVFITSGSVLIFNPNTNTLVSLEYSEIVLHAVSSDPPSLYLQIESADLSQTYTPHDLTVDMVELFLSPPGSAVVTVDSMFSALSKCAAMHPEEVPSGQDDSENGTLSLDHFLNDPNHEWITADNAGQFDDAEMEPHELDSQEANGGDGDGSRKWRRTG